MSSRWVLALALVLGCNDAPPQPVRQPTAASPSSTPAPPNPTLQALHRAIDERYSHRDRLGLDWNALFSATAAELPPKPSRDELVSSLAKLLAHAEDPHLALVVDGKLVPTDTTKVEWNFALSSIRAKVPDLAPRGRCLTIGHVGGFTYVLVNGLEQGRCDGLPADWTAAFPSIANAPGLLLDLRGNGGGNELFAQHIAGSFVDAPVPYVQSEDRDPTAPGGFTPPVTRFVGPTVRPRYAKPVVVLTGRYVISSAESFALMMRAAGATLLGARTRGSSGNPKDVALGDGISVRLPSWRAKLLDGSYLEGKGVVPDVELAVTPAEVAANDVLIDAAVAELTRRTSHHP